MPLSPDDKLGPYEILGPIGENRRGQGDTRLGREVAVKTASPSTRTVKVLDVGWAKVGTAVLYV
jgi:hypothetical protein